MKTEDYILSTKISTELDHVESNLQSAIAALDGDVKYGPNKEWRRAFASNKVLDAIKHMQKIHALTQEAAQ